MKRCAICDYLEGFGSDYLGIPNNHQQVKWRAKHQEFQCDACYHHIRDSVIDMELNDQKDEEIVQEQPEEELELDTLTPALSTLSF